MNRQKGTVAETTPSLRELTDYFNKHLEVVMQKDTNLETEISNQQQNNQNQTLKQKQKQKQKPIVHDNRIQSINYKRESKHEIELDLNLENHRRNKDRFKIQNKDNLLKEINTNNDNNIKNKNSNLNNQLQHKNIKSCIKSTNEYKPTNIKNKNKINDTDIALGFHNGDFSIVSEKNAASWLGDKRHADALNFFLNLFDMTSLNILNSLYILCEKVYLRAESQIIDNILNAFSYTWQQYNINHGFISQEVIYAIAFSLFILNTDLHNPDVRESDKISRNDYIKNTINTIKEVIMTRKAKNKQSSDYDSDLTISQSNSQSLIKDEPPNASYYNSTSPLDIYVNIYPFLYKNPDNNWYNHVKSLLKIFYDTLLQNPLPCGTFPMFPCTDETTIDQNNRSIPSYRDISGTDSIESNSNSQSNSTTSTSDLSHSNTFYSNPFLARSVGFSHSLNENNAVSNGLSRQSTRDISSNSLHSLRSVSGQINLKLSHKSSTISLNSIKNPPSERSRRFSMDNLNSSEIVFNDKENSKNNENHIEIENDSSNFTLVTDSSNASFSTSLDISSLELHGPPWAKEGMLRAYSRFLVTPKVNQKIKSNKDSQWTEIFAVIQRGDFYLFNFNFNLIYKEHNSSRTEASNHSHSILSRGLSAFFSKSKPQSPVVVGGGNWIDKATVVESFKLHHSFAVQVDAISPDEPGNTFLPPSITSLSMESRQSLFLLSTGTSRTLLFQAGTPEIAEEFVFTLNYWAARISRPSVLGAVSNTEYGWSSNIINRKERVSNDSSIKIHHWKAENQPLVDSSALDNPYEQLRLIKLHISKLWNTLQTHVGLWSSIMSVFPLNSTNFVIVKSNFKAKEDFLKNEINKFETYKFALERALRNEFEIFGDDSPEDFETEQDEAVNDVLNSYAHF